MKIFSNILRQEFFPLGVILILALARLIPHPPNFTPVVSVAIMSCYFFRNIYLSISVMIFSMLIADIFLGFHKYMFFVYLSLLLIILVFSKFKTSMKFRNLFVFSFFGALIFYLISNFGVWALSETYTKNLTGLLQCYVLAIPFFSNTFLSTLLFSYLTFLGNYLYESKITN